MRFYGVLNVDTMRWVGVCPLCGGSEDLCAFGDNVETAKESAPHECGDITERSMWALSEAGGPDAVLGVMGVPPEMLS